MSDAPYPSWGNWPVIICAVFGGAATAVQIGKASAILTLLGDDFGVGLSDTTLYLSLFSLGAALLGTLIGVLAARIDPLRAGLVGLALIGAGSFGGSFAQDWTALLLSRMIEALGLPLVVCTMPALIQNSATERQRVFALGLWSAWLPLGIALALGLTLIGDLAEDWRALSRVCGVIPLTAACLLTITISRHKAKRTKDSSVKIGKPDGQILFVALLFAIFHGCYLTVQGFIPTVAMETWGLTSIGANRVGGIAALFVIFGNLTASFLLARHFPATMIFRISIGTMALAAVVIFGPSAPPYTKLTATLIFTAAAGFPPAVIWSRVPVLSHSARVAVPIVAGTLYQGAGIGQLAGPVIAGLAVEQTESWLAVASVTGILAALGIFVARTALGEPNHKSDDLA